MSLHDVNDLLAECPHTRMIAAQDVQIRTDSTGHFVIFEDSERGENVAEKCFNFFDGARMDGTPVAMELHRRERGGGIGF